MKKESAISILAFLCALAPVTGLQAQDNNPPGLTPTITVWDDYIDIAERFNEPGRFTTIIGYEWTSTEKGNNLHRNVLYRDGGDRARRMVPYTTAESFNPEDLWEWMSRYEEATGGQVLAIAHNGIMFPVETNPA